MNRAHSESGYVFKNPPNNSSNTLSTLNEALAEIALRKGSIKIEWADELRNMYGNKWLSDCADKLDPKLLSEIKDQTFLS